MSIGFANFFKYVYFNMGITLSLNKSWSNKNLIMYRNALQARDKIENEPNRKYEHFIFLFIMFVTQGHLVQRCN